MGIVMNNITGSANPSAGSDSEWAADATAVHVAGDITNQVGVIAPTENVANGQKVTVGGPLGAEVHGVEGGPVSVSSKTVTSFVYMAGAWYPVN